MSLQLGITKEAGRTTNKANEDKLRHTGVLRAHNLQALPNTMIYMNSLYFALRSGDEHHQLRYNPCQIQLVECPGERPYFEYTEVRIFVKTIKVVWFEGT